ncbi:MAG: GSU2403 family nucleotidyltransferase fold protein [Candidatus Omnitrophota bacterium]|nr:GSU2403 family nucleotidyltransferase fold protein [Candidatus Omnitrophota bacterium]
MEKKQYELCLEILKRLNEANILDNFILIGSWCIYFYKDYFSRVPYINLAAIRTRDIDFLIDNPSKIKQKVDIPELLRDLGFVATFKGSEGYVKLDHPDLILEFLVPERGRGIDKPYPLPKLGINAVTLRFLTFLSSNTIKVKVEDFDLSLPHPANFALHKLIIFQRRLKKEKAIKDRSAAIQILRALIAKGESRNLRQVFENIPRKWRLKIINGLNEIEEKDMVKVLK